MVDINTNDRGIRRKSEWRRQNSTLTIVAQRAKLQIQVVILDATRRKACAGIEACAGIVLCTRPGQFCL